MQIQLFFDSQKEAALFFLSELTYSGNFTLKYSDVHHIASLSLTIFYFIAKITHYLPHSLQSEDYDEEYTSFPLAVTLQQRLYFQVSVDTPDTQLGISADFCYATPINSLSQKTKYDIILDGSVPIVVAISSTCYYP